MLFIALYLKGADLDPDDVTKSLGVQPSTSQRNGQKRPSKSNKEIVAKTGMWGLTTDGKVPSSVFKDHIDYLKSVLGPSCKKMGSLPNVEFAFLDVFISISKEEGDDPTFHFEMPAQTLEELKEFGLPVQFTIYA